MWQELLGFTLLATFTYNIQGFPGGAVGKEATCQCRRHTTWGFDPWVGKIPWRRKWHPTPVLLPGKSHGQRSLVGYSPWGRKESDTTERLHFHFFHFLSLWTFYALGLWLYLWIFWGFSEEFERHSFLSLVSGGQRSKLLKFCYFLVIFPPLVTGGHPVSKLPALPSGI